MEHAIKIAAAIVDRLPKDTCSPETTEGKEGFLHPIGISGALEKATLGFIVRDFTDEGLKEKEALLESIVKEVMKGFPRSTYRLEIKQQYRNMKQVIDRHPEIVDYAMEAIRRAGLKPVKASIRGGTDGSRLSFMGLPCPNIFAGEHAFHSRLEWVSRAGHGKGRADHRPSRDDLGRAGLRSSRGAAPPRSRSMPAAALPVPGERCERSRIEFAAAARKSGGCPSSARLAGPISSALFDRGIKAAPDRDIERQITRLHFDRLKPASPSMRCTRCFGSKREWTRVFRSELRQFWDVLVGCLKRQHQPGVFARLAPAHECQPARWPQRPSHIGEGNCRLGKKHHAEARDQ